MIVALGMCGMECGRNVLFVTFVETLVKEDQNCYKNGKMSHSELSVLALRIYLHAFSS